MTARCPSHVVVDTKDGYVFSSDSNGTLDSHERAMAFRDERNAEMKPEHQSYEVYALVHCPGIPSKATRAYRMGAEHARLGLRAWDMADSGAARLMDALGERSPLTEANHDERWRMARAYEAGYHTGADDCGECGAPVPSTESSEISGHHAAWCSAYPANVA